MLFRALISPRDVEALRVIRNSCRRYMTRHVSSITKAQQARWWRERDSHIQVYLAMVSGRAVGYGLLHITARGTWVSGGLVHDARGRGHGRQLFDALIILTGASPCLLEVRKDNARALSLYTFLGFRVSGTRRGLRGARILRMQLQRSQRRRSP